MTALFGLLTATGLSAKIAKWLEPVLLVLAAVLLLWGVYALIHHDGETAGAAKVTAKAEAAHTAAVAASRSDEQTAQVVSNRIAASVARSDDITTDYVHSKIEDMHDAYDAVPPAAPAASPPPAPIDSVRIDLNAAIARANGAAETAGSAAGDDADGNASAPDR